MIIIKFTLSFLVLQDNNGKMSDLFEQNWLKLGNVIIFENVKWTSNIHFNLELFKQNRLQDVNASSYRTVGSTSFILQSQHAKLLGGLYVQYSSIWNVVPAFCTGWQNRDNAHILWLLWWPYIRRKTFNVHN